MNNLFNNIISYSLRNKIAILIFAVSVMIVGGWSIATMKVDILPDINKPTVTIFAESDGLAAEEVERLVLNPIEVSISGAAGVERVRSTASFSQAIVNVEFAWGSDILRDRQIIQERLSQASLPPNVKPVLGPPTSLIGEIVWIGISSPNQKVSPMELRTLADWTIRPALLRTPGVANVLVMGGDAREWQINLNAERMKRGGIMMENVRNAIRPAISNQGGGFITEGGKEYPIRVLVAPSKVSDLGSVVVGKNMMTGQKVRLGDIATIEEGASPIRGSALIDGKPGVIFRIIRQPDAETLKTTKAVDETLKSLKAGMPDGITIHPNLFRQENFIRAGLGNVTEALRDGIIMVIIILLLFLMNIRATAITLTAIPLSIMVTAIVFKYFGLSVNVMTLGGIAIAVGELVDDAIVDVENIFRRLRLWKTNKRNEERENIIFQASSEVRNSIVYATLLVSAVFLPIFFVPNIEGRLLISLGAAYLVSLVASMVVSLTVTPVLSSYLLNDKALAGHEKDTRIVQIIKRKITPLIYWCIAHIKALGATVALAVVLTAGLYGFAGKEGIPTFNEGSAAVMFYLPSGTALSTTNAYVANIGKELMKIRGVRQISNSSGRAPGDPHAAGANASEMQIAFEPGFENDKERLFREIQTVLDRFGGAEYSLGQPITHRVEMQLSGVRAPVVVKVYGNTTEEMTRAANQVVFELKKHSGITNPRIEQNTFVPELRVYVDQNRLAEQGISGGTVAEEIGMGLMGDTLGNVRLGPASVPVVARYDLESKGTMSAIRDLSLPFPEVLSLGSAADIRVEGGLNTQGHEGGKRVLVVSANYQGRDIVGEVEASKTALENTKLPMGVTLSFEGTYKSQKETTNRLTLVFLVGILLVLGLLYHAFRSVPITLLIMANIPTVLIGGMIAVWISGGVINMAHLVGFISLAGIVSRNGIMLIGRCLSLIRSEGKTFSPETVVQATLDRTVPVLMTSLVTSLALLPLLFSGDAPGKEMLHPLAVVIFGGLISSTAISLFLTPALFYRFGKKAALQDKSESSGF
ncbi:MAG: efflux RND transporter permease subunit [Candidatus Parcubacteria bacterium]|nr:efflux RND transporter permease subunit [Candidatus Parcubacteria bacterium]